MDVAGLGVLAVLWAAWLASWLAAARWSARTVIRQPVGERILHSVPIWGGLILVLARPEALGSLPFPATDWLAWAGIALALAGLAWTWWARIHLGRMWSIEAALKEGHTLVRSGPYALTRHPIYSGLLVAFAGTELVDGRPSTLIGLLVIVAGLVLKLRQEERILASHFGEAYRSYQSRVRALVPGIW